MNKVILTGRLIADPTVNVNGENKYARYRLAVDRRVKRNPDNPNQQTADFIGCVAFGKSADFVDKYLRKGIKIGIVGHIQTGKYTGNDGQTVYTTDVVVEEHEFCESKNASANDNAQSDMQSASNPAQPASTPTANEPFVNIPDGIDDELPFN
jgi:single-strand DNA-binding protein